MRVRRTFDVKSGIAVDDSWPMEVDGYELTWNLADGVLTSVALVRGVTQTDILPTIQGRPAPGISAHINVGLLHDHDQLEASLLRIQGLLSLFANITIDFESETTEFIAETDDDEASLKRGLSSFSGGYMREDPFKARSIDFDMVAKISLLNAEFAEHDVALSFLRRGHGDFRERNYISSYYNCYFLLETLLAQGLHRNKEVIAKFKSSSEFLGAVGQARSDLASYTGRGVAHLKALLAKDDDQLTKYLVETRGHLHHHIPGKPGAWHPEKQDSYHADALMLLTISHYLAMDLVMPKLFSDEAGRRFFEAAKRQDAVTSLVLDASASIEGKATKAAPIVLRFPGRVATAEMIAAADRESRKILLHSAFKDVLGYSISSEDGAIIYARYERASEADQK